MNRVIGDFIGLRVCCAFLIVSGLLNLASLYVGGIVTGVCCIIPAIIGITTSCTADYQKNYSKAQKLWILFFFCN